jgi:hypothetical protein
MLYKQEMHLKLKTIVFAVILSFFSPLEANDSLDCNVNSGHIKYSNQYQTKDKRNTNKLKNYLAKNKNWLNDAELLIECHHPANSSIYFLNVFSASPDFIQPATKYAVWSKSTYF